jgi:TetR/AcrR family transcriptional regulator, transcriptional repressor for nem operon
MLDTRETIMSIARTTVQAHGYGGLSFRELAKAVGIKSASIHYHFPTKGDLAAALAKRYSEDANAVLEAFLSESPDAATCLKKYTDVFRLALANNNRMCLCGFLAAEYDDVPEAVRVEVRAFADINVAWLAKVLSRIDKRLSLAKRRQRALAIFAAVGGAQLAARSRADVSVYDGIVASYRDVGLIPG